ncbi:hypothetical protein PIB30_084589 [Stylosanthes scabra]|uniref:Nodulin-like domain-containing protein n=1 Tax=Stylosanthes scabra TaxID=79078 RepID=A0ABU6XV84_9FABA|nr:hypothetical protein [Stylosanthes scabra]
MDSVQQRITLYTFSIYSQTLKSTLNYDQSTLNTVSVWRDIGVNVGVISCLLYDFAACRTPNGPWLIHLLGSAQCFLGYFLIWVVVAVAMAPVLVPVVCLFMFVAAQAQSYFNTSNIVTGVHNFPDYSGTIVGIMKPKFGAKVAEERARNEKIAKKSLEAKSRAYAYPPKGPMRTHQWPDLYL